MNIQSVIAEYSACALCNNVSHAKAILVAINKNMLLGSTSLAAKMIRQVHVCAWLMQPLQEFDGMLSGREPERTVS